MLIMYYQAFYSCQSRIGHVHEKLTPMLQIEKPSKLFFWDKLITNRVISKKNGENFCFNGRTGVRQLKLI